MATRCGYKWTIKEILDLQREYELLEWTIQEIATKHKRTVRAILCRLEDEKFINSWQEARGIENYNFMDNNTKSDDDSYNDSELNTENCVNEVEQLTNRIWNLETDVGEIKHLVKEMFETLCKEKKTLKKVKPLSIIV
jgi:predicted  nucleic acid-binding Zn-ribbon protein